MMKSHKFFLKKFPQKKLFSGQATIEYLLLTALVVGILLSIYQRRIRDLLGNFKKRETQYTDVVQQKSLGIPIAWFGGKYGEIGNRLEGAGGSGATAGSGQTAGDTNQGDGTEGDGLNNGGLNSGNNAGSDPRNRNNNKNKDRDGSDDGDNEGASNVGGRQPRGNENASGEIGFDNSGPNKNKSKARGRGLGDDGFDGDSDSEESESGRQGRRKSATEIRGEGSLGDDQKDKAKEKKEEQTKTKEKTKDRQADEELQKQKQLYGSNKKTEGAGGCSKIDTSALVKIALIVGLLFFLAGMLFQKRGDGQD